MMQSSIPSLRRDSLSAFGVLRDMVLALSFLLICRDLYHEVNFGGGTYKQGDWLINNLMVEIRRGPFGAVLLRLSDAIGVGPLVVLALFKSMVLAVLFLAFRGLVRQVPDPRIALLLAVSPAIFTLCWAASPAGALRKELLAFAALALVGGAVVQANRGGFALGALLLAASFWAHEALVLFVPLYLWLASQARRSDSTRTVSLAATAVVLLSAIFALLYALVYRHIPDPAVVCQPLLDRGLEERICGGAIDWLGRDMGDVAEPFAFWLTPPAVFGFILSYLLALAPLVYILSRTQIARRALGWALVVGLPFLPLYPVAVDWGRWMSLHVFSASVVVAVAFGLGKLVLARPLRTDLCLGLVTCALLISPHHVIGAVYGGFFVKVAEFTARMGGKFGALVGI